MYFLQLHHRGGGIGGNVYLARWTPADNNGSGGGGASGITNNDNEKNGNNANSKSRS